MSIAEFIQDKILRPRLQKAGSLVVYDPAGYYQSVCDGLADEKLLVVDASKSSIESRVAAMQGLRDVIHRQLAGILVYVPTKAPESDEERQTDPFAPIAAAGAIFPEGDGDSFQSLCLKAKPDHTTAIRAIFEQDASPSFAVVDAIGGGLGWPNLRALLAVESARDILFALLVPNDAQQAALKGSDSWVTEARDLLRNSMGLTLKTRGKTWDSVANELWRFVLFSEFVFDLPGNLPVNLNDVPRAEVHAKPLIEDLCERLRNDRRTQTTYIERAEEIERDFNLVSQFDGWSDLGNRDTFPFEERTFLSRAIDGILRDDIDQALSISEHRQQSVWTGKGESRAQWDLIRSAAELLQTCDDMERQLSDNARNLDVLVAFYVSSLREADRLHREFEQAVGDFDWQDTQSIMTPVKQQVRKQYGKLVEKAQLIFTRHVEQCGWPLAGQLSNADVFDRIVAPKLQKNGHKVAFFMIDALRYELGVALERQLLEDGQVEIQAAMAQLPSITPVGMASLLPGAGQQLRLKNDLQSLVPMLGDQVVATVAQRMDVLCKKYGQRFEEGRLEEFVRGRFDFSPETDLLVLRAVEIDSHFENHPDTAPAEITNALKRIRVAIHKLKERGFHEVVIATDHGFFMNTHAGAGDVCRKPAGNWIGIHDRCALGDGAGDGNHLVISAEKMGIRGEFAKFAAPYSLAAYRSSLLYYHGGISLQECVVPVITMQLKASNQPTLQKASVAMSYKNGAKAITTRMPVIDLAIETTDMFSIENNFEILLEAHNKKGDVVGEAKAGGVVNPATGTLSLTPGDKVQVTLRMHMDFEGKFKVKALHPTTYTVYCQLDLETDYAV
ncbi:PglZ domain-containing protein [Aeromonas hydrophila]|uniref:PglZ domain-containing protein n=1 Tax=Aeromonas hydrophila TaxID=644 RepID=UPI001F4C20B0|nr:PglZ domain-containing protein [Aeromonas hydrophila]MCO4198693.1 PglZ domain-containing protein [Aeromonas hydrophila]UNB60029.1 PglZ domain-containing protein [Aeromonas hydrophila]